MAVVAAACWLRLRSWLGQPLTGRRARLCEQARSCRFYSGSATLSKVEGTDITGIEEVVIPKKKTWDKVAVLQALASTVNRVSRILFFFFFKPKTWLITHFLTRLITHLILIPRHYSGLNCCGSRKFL
ncbi:small ribosomal subunit protein mS39-like [Hylobates moloch]|uniref:small ribosomal subunit protein mS39-like n=1 Tax=Hylobates moloch TaxID=81572 RepID=UPI0026751B9D|nr:small ribosomal subunit protein mS39-like [Hylobates moloch]